MPVPTNFAEEDALLNEVLQRSATDPTFRNRLLTNANAALEEVVGVPFASLPKQPRIKFVEKDKGVDSVIVLPDYVDPNGTLSDAELEAVAGGDWCITSCSLSITICQNTDGNKQTCQD